MNEIWYPDADFVQTVSVAKVPILFPLYDGSTPDFQYLGGDQGRGQLESALARPKPVFGKDRYPTIADKAAALIWSITKNHPFNDGNKRAALTTGFSFLVANRYFVLADQDEAVQMCLGIADNEIGHDEEYVSAWLQRHIMPLDDFVSKWPDQRLQNRFSELAPDRLKAWVDFYRVIGDTRRILGN